jgi:hypothetical protein
MVFSQALRAVIDEIEKRKKTNKWIGGGEPLEKSAVLEIELHSLILQRFQTRRKRLKAFSIYSL